MTAWKNAINDKDKKWWNKKIKNSINEWTMHEELVNINIHITVSDTSKHG